MNVSDPNTGDETDDTLIYIKKFWASCNLLYASQAHVQFGDWNPI